MWSEEFDKRARDAAGNHSPVYDDKNWDNMEALLNKHLPVEKKKRRFIFWWILPIIIGVTGLLIFTLKPTRLVQESDYKNNNVSNISKTAELSQQEPSDNSTPLSATNSISDNRKIDNPKPPVDLSKNQYKDNSTIIP